MRERAPRFQAPGRDRTGDDEAQPVTAPPDRPTGGGVSSLIQAPAPMAVLPRGDALTKEQAAVHADVTKRTIARWISQGSLNRYTARMNRVMVSKRELDALLAARAADAPQA